MCNALKLRSDVQKERLDSPLVLGSAVDNAFDSSHVTMTYNGLAILLILKDDLAGVDRNSILKGLKVELKWA